MKCKAACSGLSPKCVRALNRLRSIILQRVVGPHLHRPKMTSAGFYVQKSDHADAGTHDPFCEVRLTGVSLADDRSVQDFLDARNELEEIYRETIERFIGSQDVNLFVVLMLDGSPKVGMSSVLEGDEVVIPGKRKTRTRAK